MVTPPEVPGTHGAGTLLSISSGKTFAKRPPCLPMLDWMLHHPAPIASSMALAIRVVCRSTVSASSASTMTRANRSVPE